MAVSEWALALSIGSVLLSVLALWRSARCKTLDLRAQLRRDVAELRVSMDELVGHINRALQSTFPSSIEGAAPPAARREADMDGIQLEALRRRLNEIDVVAPLCARKTLEAKCAIAQAIRTRLRQLADKYALSAAAFGRGGEQSPRHVACSIATTRH